MRILTLHNKYKFRGGEDESSETEDRVLRNYGHIIFRYEQDNSVIGSKNLVQIAGRAIYSSGSYTRVRELIRSLRPQVVDVHNFFPLISPSAYYACAAERVPVVQTLHNYRLVCPSALFFRDGKPCEDCLGKRFPYPGIQHRCYRGSALGSASVASMIGVHRLLNTWRDRVSIYITLTEFCRKKFIQAGLPADKICVKPNFVYPDPGVGDGSGDFALFVGRLAPDKGLRTMLHAWQLLRCPIHLAIVGEGPMQGDVAEQSSKSSYIQWLGRRPVEEVYELMGKAKFLVFPSESYETFGRVAIEAFAKGTPVIVSHIGAIAELVEHGRTGWHFQPRNAEALAAVVEHILTNPQLVPAMRREARREFEMKYTAEINYRRSMEIFNEAITRFPNSRTVGSDSLLSAAQADPFIRVY
jgi:glycosyltransferase involved in cell wall biosynthesis